MNTNDTIAAIATPSGAGGIGIIRISGIQARPILEQLFCPFKQEPYQSHKMYLGKIYQPKTKAVLDKALAVLMASPNSYTKEDIVELHCHGGPLVLSLVLQAVLSCGARLAQPGEFTMRAFLNGALSLAEAEAVADLISAKTASSAGQAAQQLAGHLKAKIEPLEQKLLDLLAAITVAVDFPDDADCPSEQALISELTNLRQNISAILASADLGRIYREGINVVLAGAANVGKSSLLNCLLGDERAIVSAQAGTTRDIIEEGFNLDGIPLILRDTAGIRDSEAGLDEVEIIGIKRSRQALSLAQISLIIFDSQVGLDATALAILAEKPAKFMIIANKSDLLDPIQYKNLENELLNYAPLSDIAFISAKQNIGIEPFLAALKAKIIGNRKEEGREFMLNNIRHQEALKEADYHLAAAITTLEDGLTLDLCGVDLEAAWQALGTINGKTAAEEVITNIFANFCVGK